MPVQAKKKKIYKRFLAKYLAVETSSPVVVNDKLQALVEKPVAAVTMPCGTARLNNKKKISKSISQQQSIQKN
jgi:hypothetical protein